MTEPLAFCLIANGTPNAKYYASRHFYRFIRPGARQVESSSSSTTMQVAAFKHPVTNCLTVVLLNTAATPATVNLLGSGLPSEFTMETSTASAKRVQSTVGASGISVPATSVVTLVSGQYAHTEPAIAVRADRAKPSAASVRHQAAAAASSYTLTGKRLASDVQATAGTVVVQQRATRVVRLVAGR
jgi:hypothetical protein